jgi:hypothetical protein
MDMFDKRVKRYHDVLIAAIGTDTNEGQRREAAIRAALTVSRADLEEAVIDRLVTPEQLALMLERLGFPVEPEPKIPTHVMVAAQEAVDYEIENDVIAKMLRAAFKAVEK